MPQGKKYPYSGLPYMGLSVAPPFFSFEIFRCSCIDGELTILLFIYFFIELKYS